MNPAKLIRLHRRAINMSQYELANLTGTTQTRIWRIEELRMN